MKSFELGCGLLLVRVRRGRAVDERLVTWKMHGSVTDSLNH